MASPLLVAQQVFSMLSSAANDASPNDFRCGNGSATTNSTNPSTSSTTGFPADLSMPSLIAFFFSLSAMREWMKLLVLGSALESLRRFAFYLYYKVYNSFFLNARFEEDDSSYDWMCYWLSQQKTWKTARDVQVSTESFGLDSMAEMIEGEEDDPDSIVHGGRKLSYLPAENTSHSMWYKGHWMRITRGYRDGSYGRRDYYLELCILARGHTILNELLIEAKKKHKEAQKHLINVYVSDVNNSWRNLASRAKRPLNSIILDPGIKDLIVDDARDFLSSKSWYAARGIPFRRGYLLYGAPGSGKTSIIHSLAGELNLDVYIISLSRSGLDDTALSEMISDLPEKCIALMEDIDAAFGQTINRDSVDEDVKEEDKNGERSRSNPSSRGTSKITLSGLLNALDGVAAQEGRILFATTNKYTSLDPALCRPGRMDIHVEFQLASKFQAQELFRCFYVPDSEKDDGDAKESVKEKDGLDSGYSSADEKATVEASFSSTGFAPGPVTFSGETHRRGRRLSAEEIDTLAKQFAEAIPEREFSMAGLQGYLMGYKIRPYDAIKGAAAWVEKERAEKIKKANSQQS